MPLFRNWKMPLCKCVRVNKPRVWWSWISKEIPFSLVSWDIAKSSKNHPNTEKSEAAKRSIAKIEAYGKDAYRRAYRDETAIIRNLVEDFEQPQADADITLIGAKEWLTLLKPVNKKFDELHSSRTVEQSEKEVGQTKEARTAMQEKFDRLCKAIDALAFVKGEEPYRNLANAINEEIKKALEAGR